MSDLLLTLVLQYGVWLIALTTFFSCLALPVPASLMMVGGGAFAAGGDLSLIGAASAAFGGAVAGDQTGYAIGRRGARFLDGVTQHSPKRAVVLERARKFFVKWGHPGVFLSRWLVSPLGPYVNFIGGATGLDWRAFTLWAAAGEVIWVSLYVSLGYAFSSEITMVADLASNISGLIAALAVSVFSGWLLLRASARKDAHKSA